MLDMLTSNLAVRVNDSVEKCATNDPFFSFWKPQEALLDARYPSCVMAAPVGVPLALPSPTKLRHALWPKNCYQSNIS